MQRALDLARLGQGRVEPNPMVGCVLLREGQVLGEGYHRRFGEAHAEVEAIRDARQRGENTEGATAVVTLEPCCHHGKTPPCVEALREAKVARVVGAMTDPDPRVAGQGYDQLRAAGITVEVGVLEQEARRLNAPFIKRVTRGLPWVIAKWAQTLDGKTATADGDSKWISNERSRQKVHELRARVDAVLVGVQTVIADDPALTARDVEVLRVARRLVADRSGRMPTDAKMRHDGGPPVGVLTGDLDTELRQLSKDGVTNILLEGGATLTGAMMQAGLVDEAWVFVAPKIAGDPAALDPAVIGALPSIAQAHTLTLEHSEMLGGDVWLRYGADQ